jgi:hypothetical protein
MAHVAIIYITSDPHDGGSRELVVSTSLKSNRDNGPLRDHKRIKGSLHRVDVSLKLCPSTLTLNKLLLVRKGLRGRIAILNTLTRIRLFLLLILLVIKLFPCLRRGRSRAKGSSGSRMARITLLMRIKISGWLSLHGGR